MTAILALLLTTTLPAAEPDPLLKEFGDMMLGRWVVDVTLVEDWPGVGKKGDKVVVHTTYRWTADRFGIEEDGTAPAAAGKTIYYFDPSTKKVKGNRILGGGTTGEAHFWKQDGQWVWKWGGYLPDGTRYEGQGAYTPSDGGNTVTITGQGTTGGKPQLPLKDVYRRGSK